MICSCQVVNPETLRAFSIDMGGMFPGRALPGKTRISGVGVGVSVGVTVGVGVDVTVGEGVIVRVAVAVSVDVMVAVGVCLLMTADKLQPDTENETMMKIIRISMMFRQRIKLTSCNHWKIIFGRNENICPG